MAKDIKVLMQNCLQYGPELFALCHNDSWRQVPRPLGTYSQLHATKPNDILHFDFLYVGLSRDGKYQYILLLKDVQSGYLWLVLCRIADDAATFDELMRWLAMLCVVLL
jgi:hypothetical protein